MSRHRRDDVLLGTARAFESDVLKAAATSYDAFVLAQTDAVGLTELHRNLDRIDPAMQAVIATHGTALGIKEWATDPAREWHSDRVWDAFDEDEG